MPIRYEHRETIQTTPERAFAAIDDLPLTAKWLPPCVSLEKVGAGPNAPGDKLRYVYKQGGRNGEMAGEIIARVPNERLHCKYFDAMFDVSVDLRVAPASQQTLTTHIIEITPKTLMGKIMSPLIRLGLGKQTRDAAANLKRLLEATAAFWGLWLGLWLLASAAWAADPWVVYEGLEGPGQGKHVVLVSGDEEYRSEEALPQLARILATHHGFKCTVLFAIDPQDGTINPKVNNNIPGLAALQTADLLVIFTRFRDLPDEQMKHVAEYVDSGRPIVGLRTATHAFSLSANSAYARYDWRSGEWKGGFGRQVLGETWVNHHGHHGQESTRGIIAPGAATHPILRGIRDGEIWGPTDVYTVNLPLPSDSQPLVMGEVLVGMKPDDAPVTGPKNDPMMPVAWVKSYQGSSGKTGRVFTTTMGASQDLVSEGTRRMLVNACYWALGMEGKIPDCSMVDIVGNYQPTPFKFDGHRPGVRPADLQAK